MTRLTTLAALALGCGGESLGPNGEKIVKVEDSDFNPDTKTLTVGQTVLWQWTDQLGHNVTWVAQSGTGNSSTKSTGSYTRGFSAAGTYDYYCTIHGTPTSGMHASIVVQ
jgi:plastocyanin